MCIAECDTLNKIQEQIHNYTCYIFYDINFKHYVVSLLSTNKSNIV